MGCDAKIHYPTRQQAERAARRMPSRPGAVLQPYYCATHDCWHLGHSLRPKD